MSVAAEPSIARAMNFVNGRWVEPTGGRSVERRNPANHDDLVGVVTLSTREETRAAIAAAEAAFASWRATPPPVRG
ncbi:MAG: aldehyde dehydrogenase family protein, partial [Terriglobales bacterium]